MKKGGIVTNKQLKDKIRLERGMDWHAKELAVEYARATGFQTEAAEFPVTSYTEGTPVPADFAHFAAIEPKTSQVTVPADYVASSDSAKPIQDFDWRRKRGLERVFSKGAILEDNNMDQLPDEMNVHFVMAEDADDSIVAAACNLAFRFGMETTAYSGRLLCKEEPAGNCIVFRNADICSMVQENKDGGVRVTVSGSGDELVGFVAEICETFPQQGCFDTWTDRVTEIADAFQMRTLDGQLAALGILGDTETTAYVDPDIKTRKAIAEKAFPKAEFVSYKDDELRYSKEYDIEWEVDTLDRMLAEKVYPSVKSGDAVEVRIAVSEDKTVRAEIADKITKSLEAAGAASTDVRVFCSYKQGYSWIDEDILPRLAGKKVGKFEISFKPFLAPGETIWKDEDGAIPNYNNVGGNPDHWYDMPIRFLQELYPVEDIIVATTGIEGDDVVFRAYEGDQDITYLVRVTDTDGNEILTDTYKVAYSERPYIDQYKDMGKVHPMTGYLRVRVNGAETLDERVESDVEKVWDIIQGDVLTELRAYVDEHTEGKDLMAAQPFFGRLQFDLDLSEPDERLTSREDLNSSLDALHEDIYFMITDYFKNYGNEKGGVLTDAPGLVYPKIRKRTGKPYMKVSVFGRKADEPCVKSADRRICATLGREDVDVYVTGISRGDAGNRIHIAVEGVPEEFIGSYAKLFADGVLDISERIEHFSEVVLEACGKEYVILVTAPAEIPKDVDIRDIDISEFDLIGYDRCMEIIDQLKHVKGLNVFRTTKSYTGREHYAIELRPDRTGYISRTKRITAHQTELIICRHHANEVSSTNEAFMLLRELLTNDKYSDLTEQMNLTIVPMDNVDGAALHYELQQDNPTWKLHIARFNAIGKEFYHDHFKMDTIHTEALGLRRLFMTLLPDALIDNHGVPSHEWEQQFAGYTSPSFRGFWLPRSLLYGYFYHITGDEYAYNIKLNERIQDVIADNYLDNEEVTRENKLWARQFEKYAHGWMPKMFPATYYKNMINYWIPSPYNPEHRYPSIRFPWILSLDYVSEVADETAQGEYLNRCARAHLEHDKAIIGSLRNAHKVYREEWNFSDSDVRAELTRKRPIFVD